MQIAEGQELLDAKRAVAAVKKVCRLRTAVAWKEWRAREEESTGAQLQVCAAACGALLCYPIRLHVPHHHAHNGVGADGIPCTSCWFS